MIQALAVFAKAFSFLWDFLPIQATSTVVFATIETRQGVLFPERHFSSKPLLGPHLAIRTRLHAAIVLTQKQTHSTKKNSVMKPSTSHRELLLFKSTSFTRRQFGPESESKVDPTISDFKQEEHNRQAAILRALFQSSNEDAVVKDKLFIWQVDKLSSFVHLSVGNSPLCTEKAASVDPYFFWATLNMN